MHNGEMSHSRRFTAAGYRSPSSLWSSVTSGHRYGVAHEIRCSEQKAEFQSCLSMAGAGAP
jgi:hypothetical protein